MKEEGRNSLWQFMKVKGGYVRYKHSSDQDVFMFRVLGNKLNRSMWRRICEVTLCKLIGHMRSDILDSKGFTNELGNFEFRLCKTCRCKVMFYTGGAEK